MPRSDRPPYASAEVELTVAPADTASAAGAATGDRFPEVFATARMISLMETAAARCLQPLLQPEELSVGVHVEIKHSSPTPVGALVRAHARFAGMEGKLYTFEVWAEDPAGEIGRGKHTRAIVDAQRLTAAALKRSGP